MTNETILYKSIKGDAPNNSSPPASSGPQPSSLTDRRRWLKMATNSVDRAGDILDLSGMDASNFEKNPQFLWQHAHSGAMVNTIGRVLKLTVQSNALFALVEYATADVNPLAEQIYQLDLLGLMPANSIGFRPLEWEANDYGGHTFTKWELIECSKVELPMNPEAVDSTYPTNRERSVSSTKSKTHFNDSDQLELFTPDDVADWLVLKQPTLRTE